MGYLLTSVGEEFVFTSDMDGVSMDVGLYNDDTDDPGDGSDVGDLTTEPGDNTNTYARQTDTFSVENPTGSDVVVNNDAEVTFDFSDQTASETVDSYFVEVSFQSTVVGSDGSATEHLVYTGALSQDRDIGSIDELNISAGGIELELE